MPSLIKRYLCFMIAHNCDFLITQLAWSFSECGDVTDVFSTANSVHVASTIRDINCICKWPVQVINIEEIH